MEDHHIPEDIHPRVLIQAIQENLGVTKKEIAERTGISYGTLNRYTRETPAIGRPRQSSINKLKQLYQSSLSRFDSNYLKNKPGAEYRASLFTGHAGPLSPLQGGEDREPGPASDQVDLMGLPREPFLKFLRRVTRYAQEDLPHFEASGYRDRQRILESEALVGDLYLTLLNDLCAESTTNPPASATGTL